MAEQQRQQLCPRLIDYLAIVGSRPNNIVRQNNNGNQNPTVQVDNSSTKKILTMGFDCESCFNGWFLLFVLHRFPNCCDVIRPKIMRTFQCHWTWCTFVSPRVVSTLAHGELAQLYVKHRHLCSRSPIKIRAKHVLAFVWIFIDQLSVACLLAHWLVAKWNEHAIPRYAVNHGAKVWRKAQILHSLGKWFSHNSNNVFFS